MVGDESLAGHLRLLTSIELFENSSFYANHPFFSGVFAEPGNSFASQHTTFQMALCDSASILLTPDISSRQSCVQQQAIENCRDGVWSTLLSMIALSSAAGIRIQSHYPEFGNPNIEALLNACFAPKNSSINNFAPAVNIFWSCSGKPVPGRYAPDHFVPLFISSIFEPKSSFQSKDSSLQQDGCVLDEEDESISINENNDQSCSVIILNDDICPDKPITSNMAVKAKGQHFPESNQEKKGSSKSQLKITQFVNKVKGNNTPKEVKQIMNKEEYREVSVPTKHKLDDPGEPNDIACKKPFPDHSSSDNFDIGFFCKDAAKLNNSDKFDLIQHMWKPEKNFNFPTSTESKKQRKFQYGWLEEFSWLVYSQVLNGCFCLPCLLFGKRSGHNSSKGKKLLNDPITYWTSALSRFRDHACTSTTHRNAVLDMLQFVNSMTNKSMPINHIMGKQVSETVARNRKIIASILKPIKLCGRQNLSLRGHRDDAKYLKETNPSNTGNFQAFLNLMIESGDVVLEEHFKKAPKNATYQSKTVQNELIECVGTHIKEKLISEIKDAKFFSILADEAQDSSNKEQLSLVLRFVDHSFHIREEFFGFILCTEGISGKAISGYIKETLGSLGLDLNNCRGQGYDGAGNMSGKYIGAAALLKKDSPLALYVHCASHRLNLCVANTCKIQPVKIMMALIKSVSDFFNNSPKRQSALLHSINDLLPTEKRRKLTDVCRTRWIERIEGLELFIDMYQAVVHTLEYIKDDPDKCWNDDSSVMANGLYSSITKFEFIITLVVVSNCMNYLMSATRKLQLKEMDIMRGFAEMDLVQSTLLSIRSDIESKHKDWFKQATKIAESVNRHPAVPRTCRKQTLRENHPSTEPEEYYRRVVSVQFLDHLTNQLALRFNKDNFDVVKGFVIVPSLLIERVRSGSNWKDDFSQFISRYLPDLHQSERVLQAELDMWEIYWLQKFIGVFPDTVGKTLLLGNEIASTYPNIFTALRILATIPITSNECERSISSLRRLKTFLRTSMGQERMNSLALMHVHRAIKIDDNEVINMFSRRNARRLQLNNVLSSDSD